MSLLILAILLTLGVSAFCSLLEAFILSTTTADIESLRLRRGRSGAAAGGLQGQHRGDDHGHSDAQHRRQYGRDVRHSRHYGGDQPGLGYLG